jgi:hypothetical protein
VADRGEHPLHLVLAAFVDAQLDGARAEEPGLGGSGRAVVEVDPCAEALELLFGRVVLDPGFVDLLDLVARVREAVRELAVVREQERAGRVDVEPAHRDDPRRVVDEVDDGSAALGVARGRDRARRLVQEHVGQGLELDTVAVELDAVAALDEGVQLPGLAVDGHPARLDQLVCPAP